MFTHVSRGPDGCDLLSFVVACYGFMQGRVFARHTGLRYSRPAYPTSLIRYGSPDSNACQILQILRFRLLNI